MNGWNLQITHSERKMIWTKPPWLCSMLIRGVTIVDYDSIRHQGLEFRVTHLVVDRNIIKEIWFEVPKHIPTNVWCKKKNSTTSKSSTGRRSGMMIICIIWHVYIISMCISHWMRHHYRLWTIPVGWLTVFHRVEKFWQKAKSSRNPQTKYVSIGFVRKIFVAWKIVFCSCG